MTIPALTSPVRLPLKCVDVIIPAFIPVLLATSFPATTAVVIVVTPLNTNGTVGPRRRSSPTQIPGTNWASIIGGNDSAYGLRT